MIVNWIKNKLKIKKLLKQRNKLFIEYINWSWRWALGSHSKLRMYEFEIDKLTTQLNDLGVYKFKYDFDKDEQGNYIYI